MIPCRILHKLLGNSSNYMPPILFPSSAKPIATKILVLLKLNGRDIVFERSRLYNASHQTVTCSKLANETK